MYDPVEVYNQEPHGDTMENKEIEKFAIWTVNSASIEITLESIRTRIDEGTALSILCGADYGTLIREINELSTYASTESEVTWLSERIVEMHKCILDDLRLLEKVTDESTLWTTSLNRSNACVKLLEAYRSWKLRDKDTEALIEKSFRRLVSICMETPWERGLEHIKRNL